MQKTEPRKPEPQKATSPAPSTKKVLDLSRGPLVAIGLEARHVSWLVRFGERALDAQDAATAHACGVLASALDTRAVDARYLRAAAAIELKDEADALAAYTEILALAPNELRAWVDKATIELRQLRFKDAAASLKSAIALDPTARTGPGLRAQMLVIETLEKAHEGSGQ